MQTRIDSKRALYQFDSAYEMEQYVASAPRTWSYTSSSDKGHGPSERWDLQAGYKGACDMMRDGWIEGAQRAQDALKAFQPATPAPATRTDFYGHMPHVARFCAGAPDSMIRYKGDDSGSRPVLTLYCAINANCGERAANMANYGLAMAQYINQMEMNGTRVELYAVFANEFAGGRRGSWCWRVKRADQPLDLAVLAFSIGHPAAFRRIGFAVMERSDIRQQSNYGISDDATIKDLIDPPAGAIILNGMLNANTHAPTPQAALAHITDQIELAIKAKEGVI